MKAQNSDTPVTKKPYASPQVSVYGDIREITRTTGGGGAVNDAMTGANKTA